MDYNALGRYDKFQVAHMVEELGVPISVLEKEAELNVKRNIVNGAILGELKIDGKVFTLETLPLDFQKKFDFNIEYGSANLPPLTAEQKRRLHDDIYSNRPLEPPGIRREVLPAGREGDNQVDIDSL